MDNAMVLLGHGSGGVLSRELIRDVFVRHLGNPILNRMEDAALLPFDGLADGALAFSTDSFVVKPLFFPGGDIGKLAVCGTVNDLAMRGAQPLFLSVGLILEEGLPLADLERIARSLAEAARLANVQVVAGDTKVVERGSGDGVFINTAGIGRVDPSAHISAANAEPGDVVLLSGAMGDHGLAIMTLREGLRFDTPLESDCAPLNGLVADMVAVCPELHVLRDLTRGGLATALNEVAEASGVELEVREADIPVHAAVAAASELLGLDPLYVANEGKLLAIAPERCAETLLAAMRAHPYGREAAIIGRVADGSAGRVVLETVLGTRRLLGMLSGEQLPRIC